MKSTVQSVELTNSSGLPAGSSGAAPDEVVAVIQAVLAYIDAESVGQAGQSSRESQWSRAARLEGAGLRAPGTMMVINSGSMSLWRSSSLGLSMLAILLTVLLTGVIACGPAVATAELESDDGSGGTPISELESMPPAAPPAAPTAPGQGNRQSAVSRGQAPVASTFATSTVLPVASSQPVQLRGLSSASPNPSPAQSQTPVQAPVQVSAQAPAQVTRRARAATPVPTAHTLLRIGLALGAARVDVDAPDGAVVQDVATGETVASLPPLSQWSVKLSDPTRVVFSGRRTSDAAKVVALGASKIKPVAYTPNAAPLSHQFSLQPPADAGAPQSLGFVVIPRAPAEGGQGQLVALNGKLYRGSLWLKPAAPGSGSTALTAVNVVDLEDYLLSVLPSEMPSSWPQEALKAQAIAARSYAVANIGKHGKEGYDMKATVEDQVYSGVASEHESTCRAVAETAGIVVKYDNKPISAFFHSTSGGSTELAENVWGRKVPYLKSVPDYDDASPHFAWVKKFSPDEMAAALSLGPELLPLASVSVVTRNLSSRVRDVLVVGGAQSKTVSGETMRKVLHLPSSNFNVGYSDGMYEFAGRGSGHGLGMSQYGARALANEGYNAAQILTYYYKDVTVDYLTPVAGI